MDKAIAPLGWLVCPKGKPPGAIGCSLQELPREPQSPAEPAFPLIPAWECSPQ